MANDSMSIGEKLRALDEQASRSGNSPTNRPENKEPAEGSRENAGGVSDRPLGEDRQRQDQVPPRGRNKRGGHA